MRTLMFAALAITFIVAGHAVAEDKLSADEIAWLDTLAKAGFGGGASTGNVGISARQGPVFSEHLKPVLAKDAALSDKQRTTLLEFARIEVKAAGWIDHYPVEPGTYTVGLRQGKHNLQLVTRDAKGKIIDVDGAWLNEGTDSLPTSSAITQGGKSEMTAAWGGIEFTWRYVSRTNHADTLGTMTERKSGAVSVFSDLPEEAHIQRIADHCNKAVAANEALTGGKLPAGFRYELYLPGNKDTYTALDKLLTGGEFADNGAFTSFITGRSYVWYYSHYGENYGLPSSLLEVCIHELHHQFMYAAFPCVRYAADWWQECLAEVAAQKGLELCDKQAAENYRKRRQTELDVFTRAGRMPGGADLLADWPPFNIGSYYAAMWTVGQALAAKPDELKAILALAAEHELGSGADAVIRREFDKRYDSIDTILQNAPREKWWFKWNATVDERDGVVEVNTEIGLGGFAVLNQPASGTKLTLSGEYRWDNEPTPQVDFIFAYAIGVQTQRFLKLAWLPAKAVLFSFKEGEWETLGSYEFDSNMEVSKEQEPLWHKFTLTYDAQAGTVRFETTDNRWTQFKLNEYWTIKETRAGVGAFDGVAWFKGVTLN